MTSLAFLRAARPHQWVKNVFVLAALFFAAGERGASVAGDAVVPTLLAFSAYCLISSAVYLLNDIVDVEKDRLHPEKRMRPIAAGELSVRAAALGAVVLLILSLSLGAAAAAGGRVVIVLAAYGLMNVAYTLWLKHVVLVDAFCIATGFLLRVEAGGRAAAVEISHWAYLCMLFLALFIALNKRRAEFQQMGANRGATRASLRGYTVGFLDQMVGVLASCTILTYTMYTLDPETIEKFGEGGHLVWTVPFVVFGMARYMIIVQGNKGGENPSRILLGGDAWFLLNTLAWCGTLLFAVFVD